MISAGIVLFIIIYLTLCYLVLIRIEASLLKYEIRKAKELDAEIDMFLDEVYETICTNIEEPAGYGCGYGIRHEGSVKLYELTKEFVKKVKES